MMLEFQETPSVYATNSQFSSFLDKKQAAVVKVSHELLAACRDHLERDGFVDVSSHMPHITRATGSCENLDTTFTIRYFETSAYLAQTEQLYLETLLPSFKKVCCYGLSSRAEDKVDSRHLCEFYLIEFEEALASGETDILDQLLLHIQSVIQAMVTGAMREADAELEVLDVDKEMLRIASEPFGRITYADAIHKLRLPWGVDLKTWHEKSITELFGNKPVFITHFPKDMKFFNMRDNETDPRVVNSADLILPYSGEAVGAAEREYDYFKIKHKLLHSRMFAQLQRKGGSIDDFEYFLESLRQNGNVPHAGCGMGFNRIIQYVCQLPDIRQTSLFPIYKSSIF